MEKRLISQQNERNACECAENEQWNGKCDVIQNVHLSIFFKRRNQNADSIN